MQALINQIREEVSCCCSYHRYEEINRLLDKMQRIIDNETTERKSKR